MATRSSSAPTPAAADRLARTRKNRISRRSVRLNSRRDRHGGGFPVNRAELADSPRAQDFRGATATSL